MEYSYGFKGQKFPLNMGSKPVPSQTQQLDGVTGADSKSLTVDTPPPPKNKIEDKANEAVATAFAEKKLEAPDPTTYSAGKIPDPFVGSVAKKSDYKSMDYNEYKQQLKDLPPSVDPEQDAKLDAMIEERKAAVDAATQIYKQENDATRKKELWAGIIKGTMMIAAGMIARQQGTGITGLDITVPDFESEYKRNKDGLALAIANADKMEEYQKAKYALIQERRKDDIARQREQIGMDIKSKEEATNMYNKGVDAKYDVEKENYNRALKAKEMEITAAIEGNKAARQAKFDTEASKQQQFENKLNLERLEVMKEDMVRKEANDMAKNGIAAMRASGQGKSLKDTAKFKDDFVKLVTDRSKAKKADEKSILDEQIKAKYMEFTGQELPTKSTWFGLSSEPDMTKAVTNVMIGDKQSEPAAQEQPTTIIRRDPKSGRDVEYDAKTKQPIRFVN